MSPSRRRLVPALTSGHIYSFLRCHQLLYLDAFGDPALRDAESDFDAILRQKGKEHEEEALKELGLAISEIEYRSFEEGAKETLRLMKSGAEWIYQGCLLTPRMRGKPDLLKRTKGASRLGSHYYIPVELKSGSPYDNEENGTLKQTYVLQLAFYAHLLGQVQGVRPDLGKVIGADNVEVPVNLADCRKDYDSTLADIRAILGRRIKPEPWISSGCNQCHWKTCCIAWARKVDDVTLIRYLNVATRECLRAAGIRTVTGLAALEARKVLPEVEGIRAGKLRHFIRRAGVVKSGKPLLREPVSFPRVAVELFFDIETDPQDDICYLYGIVERRGRKQRYVSFFADSPAQERKVWKQFCEYISGLDDYHVYHFADYEKKQLRRLAKKHRCNQRLVERLFKKSTDLYREVVEKYTDWPSHSYSLKSISKILGFRYSDPDPGGMKAAWWYTSYVADPVGCVALKQNLLQYNKEDCEAMIVVRDWVVEESKKIKRQGELEL